MLLIPCDGTIRTPDTDSVHPPVLIAWGGTRARGRVLSVPGTHGAEEHGQEEEEEGEGEGG
eukprot:1348102-Rhodomonas_salina.1